VQSSGRRRRPAVAADVGTVSPALNYTMPNYRVRSSWRSSSGVGGFELVGPESAAPDGASPADVAVLGLSGVAGNPLSACTDPNCLEIDNIDFTEEETWRLWQWCIDHGADEFAVDLPFRPATTPNPLRRFFVSNARREIQTGSERWGEIELYRLGRESTEALRTLFPSGLFQGPTWDTDAGWAEDPALYRRGELMFWIISHEGFGELRVSSSEQADLARIGLRGALRWDASTCAALALPRITLGILDHEFPCVSGGSDDDLRRVHFSIESIPRVYGAYSSLNISLDTLAAWHERLTALAAGRVRSAVLRSAREGFLLRLSRPDTDGRVSVFVDGRQMEQDLWGHCWEFNVAAADVASLASQCAVALSRLGAIADARPKAAIADDSERRARLARRFPLVVEAADGG
jgi:hypothetical protein